MEDVDLVMRRDLKLELVSHTYHSCSFFGFCNNDVIAIEGLKTRHLIFDVVHEHYDLVLSQPSHVPQTLHIF